MQAAIQTQHSCPIILRELRGSWNQADGFDLVCACLTWGQIGLAYSNLQDQDGRAKPSTPHLTQAIILQELMFCFLRRDAILSAASRVLRMPH